MAKTDNWKEIISFPGYQVNEIGTVIIVCAHIKMERLIQN